MKVQEACGLIKNLKSIIRYYSSLMDYIFTTDDIILVSSVMLAI